MVAMHVYAVPLYDSLGESSVEYIIGHSEASIVFTSTQKFPLLEKTLHKTKEFIKTIVYFGDVTDDSKRTSQAAEKEVNLQTTHASCTKSERDACVRYSVLDTQAITQAIHATQEDVWHTSRYKQSAVVL